MMRPITRTARFGASADTTLPATAPARATRMTGTLPKRSLAMPNTSCVDP